MQANQKHHTYVDGINMFYVLRTTVRSTGTLESRQKVDKYLLCRDAVRILRKTDKKPRTHARTHVGCVPDARRKQTKDT